MKTLEQLLTEESLHDIRPVVMDDKELLSIQFKNNQVIACSDYVWKELNALTDDSTAVVNNIQAMAISLLTKVISNRQANLPAGLNEVNFNVVLVCEKVTMTRSYKAIAKRLDFSENWKDVTSLIFVGQHETLETLAPPQSEDQTTEQKEV